MSVNLSALKQYKSVDLRATVATASPHKLISLLYQGALESTAQAKGAIERNDIEARTAAINRCSSIILGLVDFLDVEKGGEVSENLAALYDYILRALAETNRNNSVEKADEIIQLILEIKLGWESMPQKFK